MKPQHLFAGVTLVMLLAGFAVAGVERSSTIATGAVVSYQPDAVVFGVQEPCSGLVVSIRTLFPSSFLIKALPDGYPLSTFTGHG